MREREIRIGLPSRMGQRIYTHAHAHATYTRLCVCTRHTGLNGGGAVAPQDYLSTCTRYTIASTSFVCRQRLSRCTRDTRYVAYVNKPVTIGRKRTYVDRAPPFPCFRNKLASEKRKEAREKKLRKNDVYIEI